MGKGNADQWPVLWRVTAPWCGIRGSDWVLAQTGSETDARREFGAWRRRGYPVRLERIACGPLSPDAPAMIEKFRAQFGGRQTPLPQGEALA